MDDEQIFLREYPALRRFAAAIRPAGVDADDLVQDAVARTLRSRSLASLDEPLTYLRRAVFNIACDERRRAARLHRWERLQDPPAGVQDSHSSDLSDLLSLPPAQRAVLYLTVVEGLGHDEVAAELGISAEASRARLSRGLRRLRISLTQEEAS